MPRYARRLSKSGLYHVMIRGNERKEIFFDDEDRARFLDTVQRMKEKGEYEVNAYCLMNNHVHLLFREIKDSIQRSMKRICVSYTYYFNKKYKRVGHLFQDRYRSENIDGDVYFMEVARYIHNNPVKAGIVNSPREFKWSSYCAYIGNEKNNGFTFDKEQLLEIFSENKDKARKLFIEFSREMIDDIFLDYGNEKPRKNDIGNNLIGAVSSIAENYGVKIDELKEMKDKSLRNKIVREIKEQTGEAVRELSKVLGISKDIVFRA